ncbi:MAG: short-chain dehydrogenase [Betaproteobacteria bacterium HGW-Betaproteobacteria-1]|jgi:NAD(P)-dependent dehydrogenase (short-subunit alcohol dehydrogenase family)|nr:MAG: short-chain dehydrogenase [Betaproteobacteria bacterium HGW-Betaproteobacteria-1]
MSQATVLITGANRGLGLEFAKQYAEAGWQVIACCRWPDEAKELQALAERSGDLLEIHQLDVADFEEIDALALILQGRAIDLLINNAGVYPQSDFGNVNYEAWAEAFHINSMAPMKMAEAFVGHVAASDQKKIVTVSSKMGSIDDNTSGGSYIYRSTKTAANMVMKSLAIDLKPKGIASTILHPGWVRTDMGGPNGLIDAPESVAGMRRVIEALTLENGGRFVAYDGKEIPW